MFLRVLGVAMSSKRKSARMFRVVSRYRSRIFLVINSSGQLPYTPPQGMWNHVKSCETIMRSWLKHIETLKPASECSLNAYGTVFLCGSTNPAGEKKVTLLSRSTRTFRDTSCHEKTRQACQYCKPELMSLVVASIGMVTQDISITTWTVDRRCTDGGQPSGEAECRSYPRHLHLQPPEISHWKASVLKSSILRAGGIWRNETPKLWRLVELCDESNQLQFRSSCSDSWWFSSHRNDNSFTDQHQPCRKMSRNLFPRPVFDPKYPRSTWSPALGLTVAFWGAKTWLEKTRSLHLSKSPYNWVCISADSVALAFARGFWPSICQALPRLEIGS